MAWEEFEGCKFGDVDVKCHVCNKWHVVPKEFIGFIPKLFNFRMQGGVYILLEGKCRERHPYNFYLPESFRITPNPLKRY